MSREALKVFLPTDSPVLEIGPLDKPFVRGTAYEVFYADVRETSEIVGFFDNDPHVNKSNIASIDYVIRTSYREAVGEKRFGAVFHSHVIEHVPNIIKFLRELSEILIESGKIIMAIPDKRGTFDWFRDVTPFRDAYDVYHGGSPARLAFDSWLNGLSMHLQISSSYTGDVSFRSEALEEERFSKAEDLYNDPQFIDRASPHYWVFTGKSFLEFLRDGIRCNLLPFRLEYFEDRGLLSNEFHVVLTKDEGVIHDKVRRREELLRLTDRIEDYEDRSGVALSELQTFCNVWKSVYIYGAGQYAKEFSKLVRLWGTEIRGYIVTDGFRSMEQLQGINVYELSEMKDRQVPIIVALDEKNGAGVLPMLKERGFDHVYSRASVSTINR